MARLGKLGGKVGTLLAAIGDFKCGHLFEVRVIVPSVYQPWRVEVAALHKYHWQMSR